MLTQSRYDMYIQLGKDAAAEANSGVAASQAELRYKTLRSVERGWHALHEKRTGDALQAEVAYSVGYNSARN